VVVMRNGRVLANACAGVRGVLDPQPVTPSTLFCGFSISKAVMALVAHSLVDEVRV
jgi:CubicO group peptidase (beta-lactamase class C family)